MRRAPRTGRASGLLLLALVPLLAIAAAAQPADVPTGPARLSGRVVLGGEGTPVPGVEVALYALTRDGVPGLRRAESDASGRFAFEGITNDPAVGWLVGARYRGVPFPGGRVVFEAGQTELSVEIRVDEPTPDPATVSVAEQSLRLAREPAGLRVIETLTLANHGTRTYYVAPGARSGARSALDLTLPAGASGFEVPLGVMPDGLVREERRVRWYGPVYPGSQELVWSYRLPTPAADEAGAPVAFAPEVPARTDRLVLLLSERATRIEGGQLDGPETTTTEGRSLERYVRESPPAGPLALTLRLAAARVAPEAVEVSAVRLVVQADDAALDVTETHVLEVRGDTQVLGTAETPLLHIPLPASAQRLRFGSDRPGVELAPGPDGGLTALGSLEPGEALIELAYQLPAGEEPARIERRFAAAVPVLSIFVADTGRLAPRSERLHRRRPLRTADRTYLHLEAFGVAPDESIALELGRLPPSRADARAWSLAAMAIVALGSIWLLTSPLRGSARREGEREEGELSPARAEREALYDAIRDLDHDFETGKVSAEDHARLRDELRERALVLLEAERSAASAPTETPMPSAPAVAAPPAARPGAPTQTLLCSACASEVLPSHRFCPQCGHALTSGPRRPGARAPGG